MDGSRCVLQVLKLGGRHRFHSGAFAPRAVADPAGPAPMDLPGVLAPVRILAAETGTGDTMAVLYHPHERTYTAVARIRFAGIGLADSARRDAQVTGWGRLLASLCVDGHPIIRVQAIQRSVREDGTALAHWHARHLVADAPVEAARVTAELLASAVPASADRHH
jgi:hypothetical protein